MANPEPVWARKLVLCAACLFISYFVMAPGCNDGGGNGENGHDDHSDDCVGATLIEANGSYGGDLEEYADYDFFQVDLYSAGTLRAYTGGSTDTLGGFFDSGCSMLDTDDDSGEGFNFDLSRTNTGPGTYYIAVTGALDEYTGPYTLHVGFSETSGPDMPLDCWLSFKVYVTLQLEGSDPNSLEVDDGTPGCTGEWTGDSYANAWSSGAGDYALRFTVNADRTNITSMYGLRAGRWETAGSNIPVTSYNATLQSLKAEHYGASVCDYIDSFDYLSLSEGLSFLGFFCEADSYIELSCE
ncbi:MAG: hypothetical protein ABIJ56_10075 [Pseudomonadota bacterium]